MTPSRPPITGTTHTLPFDKLSPRDFERLCLWLVEREGYERAGHLGAAGSEAGRDVVAWREGELWAFQCKRVRRFGPTDALTEVEKILALPGGERPVALVFLVICDVSANTRRQARERCTQAGLACHFWSGTELDEKVKRHPDVVEEFFGGTIIHEGLFAAVPAMPPRFVGRDDLMAGLVTRLTSGEARYFALEGLPGVGKTTLAVALAHGRQVLSHFEDGVLWASLGPGEQADPMRALGAWATALGQDISHLLTLDERQEAVKTLIGQRGLLLVIDDAWDVEAAEALRCGGPNCCHLLTTRDQGIARAFAGPAQAQSVSPLDDDPAYQLLQQLAPEACAAGPAAARGLVQAVGGLPLALALLGGYLAAPERSYFPELGAAALAEVAEPRRRLALAQKRLAGRGGEMTLQQTIALSLEDLPPGAVAAFHALGAFAPKPERFSREAAEAVAETGAATLALLAARNLVEVEGESLALHQILADVARTRLDDRARARHRGYYLALVNRDRQDWRPIEALYGQIKWAWQSLPTDASRLDWVWALRIYQERRGLWRDKMDWIEQGLTVARAEGRRKDEGTLLNNIGRVYDSLGQREKALDYFQRARPILEEVGDRAGLAVTLNNIGLVYHNLGQREKALDYYRRARPIREKVGDRAGLAVTLNNIGLVYDSLGQREKALDYYRRARPIREEVGDRAGLATTLNNIGGVYDSLGQREKALDYFQRALPIHREVGNRPMEATTLNNIGSVYDRLGQGEKALDYYRHARPIREEVGDRAGLAATLNNIGLVYHNLGQGEKALDYYRRALPIHREVGNRPEEATTLNNIGSVYYSLGQREKALNYYRRARPIMEEVGDRAGLATTLNNIGLVYHNLGQREKALDYYRRALPIREEVGDRAGLAVTLNNIGGVYYSLGQREKALDYYRRARPIREEVGDRAGLAVTLNNIGGVYNDLGQREKALDYYRRARPIREKVGDRYGESITRYNMAMIYRQQGRLAEAVAELKRVVELDRLVQRPELESDLEMLARVEAELAKSKKGG